MVNMKIKFDLNGSFLLEFDKAKSIIKLKEDILDSLLSDAVLASQINMKVVLTDSKKGKNIYDIRVKVINSSSKPDALQESKDNIPPKAIIKSMTNRGDIQLILAFSDKVNISVPLDTL